MAEANSEIVEEVKWRKPSNPDGNLVWSKNGIISTGEIYKQHLRLTLSKGVELKDYDPKGIINAHRAILIHENDKIDEEAFVKLIQEAVKLNSKNKNE